MEAKKSHNVPSVSWRTKKGSGVIQSGSEGLTWGEGRRGNKVNSGQYPKAREPLAPEGRRA